MPQTPDPEVGVRAPLWSNRVVFLCSCSGVREAAYTTLVRPQLEYAAAIWDPNHDDKIKQIEKSNGELQVGQLATSKERLV